MSTFLNLPILQAIAIVSVAHALLCVALVGLVGFGDTALFAGSLLVSAYLSKAATLKTHWAWLRGYPRQFRIWLVCSSIMALFATYRSLPRIDLASIEALTSAAFFMAMVSIGNRVLK